MELKSLYREILNEHNLNPTHKKTMDNPTLTLQGVNPSCGDNIVLNLKVEDNKIVDGSYTGSGCAVSQASVDMMLDLIIGKEKDEALKLADIFARMISGDATDKEIQLLDEASLLKDISHMPSRVKCALLGWHTMEKMIHNGENCATAGNPHCCK